jgi:hypothetical protein
VCVCVCVYVMKCVCVCNELRTHQKPFGITGGRVTGVFPAQIAARTYPHIYTRSHTHTHTHLYQSYGRSLLLVLELLLQWKRRCVMFVHHPPMHALQQ